MTRICFHLSFSKRIDLRDRMICISYERLLTITQQTTYVIFSYSGVMNATLKLLGIFVDIFLKKATNKWYAKHHSFIQLSTVSMKSIDVLCYFYKKYNIGNVSDWHIQTS